MSRLTDAVITTAGLAIGAALVGVPAGIWLARRTRSANPVIKPYSQTDAVVTSIRNLRKGKP